jgi:hypothetical protein
MATTSGEFRTYYQRDWEQIFPKLPIWETPGHVAGFALQIISLLYQPAGKVISLGSTALNTIVIGRALQEADKWEIYYQSVYANTEGKRSWKTVNGWSILKNGAEFIGTIASLKMGLAIHSLTKLGEKSYKLVGKFKTLTRTQIGKRMVPIVSNALYLLTLVSFSTPVSCGFIGASLMFQAGMSLYKTLNAYEMAYDWNPRERVKTAAYGSMTVIYLAKAGLAIRQCST